MGDEPTLAIAESITGAACPALAKRHFRKAGAALLGSLRARFGPLALLDQSPGYS